MRINFITLSTLLITCSSVIYSQLEIKLETDKVEYQRNDSVIATYKIKNVSSESIVFVNKCYLHTDENCYGVYKYDDYVELNRADHHKLDAFITLRPLEEISITKILDIGWMCRSAPPGGDWNIELMCSLSVNDSDNYYFINDSENQEKKINVFDGWNGSVESNKANIIIRRTD